MKCKNFSLIQCMFYIKDDMVYTILYFFIESCHLYIINIEYLKVHNIICKDINISQYINTLFSFIFNLITSNLSRSGYKNLHFHIPNN